MEAAGPLFNRRHLLKLSAATAVAAPVIVGADFARALGLDPTSFQYGVASGDPLPDGFVIWTRVTPEPAASPGSGLGAPTQVRWIVAADEALTSVVQQGVVTTDPARDHTVKVDVGGLDAATGYFYGFRIEATGEASRVGAARTAPAAGDDLAQLTFGFVSCSNYEAGWFVPYRYLAGRCLDFVLHVGDYTYEYGNGEYGDGPDHGRLADPPTDTVTLADYRRRQAIHKADADLQALHAACSWITTMDDHESADNAWRLGAVNHDPATQGDWAVRRAASFQAYDEWMPIRPASAPDPAVWYRTLRFGTLAELVMLDLRQYRDQQPTVYTGADGSATDTERTMLGAEQRQWLSEVLDASPAPRWRLLGNSVQLMQVDYPALGFFVPTGFGSERNVDAWDGYVAERLVLQSAIGAYADDVDVVVLTGDIHSSWAAELPPFTGGQVTAGYQSGAVEFVCPSITSDGFKEVLTQAGAGALIPALTAALRSANPHVKLIDGIGHGCCVVRVTPEHTQCDWYFTTSAAGLPDERWDPDATCEHAYSYRTVHGTKALAAVTEPIVDDCPPVLPPPVVPESPWAVALPVSALAAAAGAALVLHRRATAIGGDDHTGGGAAPTGA